MLNARDLWHQMRQLTSARIGIGRAGVSVPTKPLLDFQLGFARARDAVHTRLNVESLARAASPSECVLVSSLAADRATYLLRPDLGRTLNDESAALLACHASDDGYDLAFVIGDGLSAGASQRYALDIIARCADSLSSFRIAPLVVASQARVALADHVAEVIGARSVMILLGERPGLTTAESLGIYFSWNPRVGMPDSDRNCISNIHNTGLHPQIAARMACWLVREASRLKLSGVMLKEDAGRSAIDGWAAIAISGTAKS